MNADWSMNICSVSSVGQNPTSGHCLCVEPHMLHELFVCLYLNLSRLLLLLRTNTFNKEDKLTFKVVHKAVFSVNALLCSSSEEEINNRSCYVLCCGKKFRSLSKT